MCLPPARPLRQFKLFLWEVSLGVNRAAWEESQVGETGQLGAEGSEYSGCMYTGPSRTTGTAKTDIAT